LQFASSSCSTPRFLPAALLLVLCAGAWSGCAGDDDNGDGMMTYVPPVTTGDAGMLGSGLQPDGGTSLPSSNPDGGSGTLVPHVDAGSSAAPDSGALAQPDSGSGAPDAGGTAPDAGGSTRPDQGTGDGKDVVTIGDSWMNLSPGIGIQDSLERISMRDYRNNAVAGTRLLDGDQAIPTQYEAAKREGPIKTVIMTGGGNDILQEFFDILPSCGDSQIDVTTACKDQIDKVAARLQTFWAEMAMDGVLDVLIIGYSHRADLLEPLSKSVDYSAMKITPICNAVPAPLRCTAVDSDMLVPNLKLRDNIHPDDAGYDAIATAIWKIMQEKGMRR
jgi:lysophospholipase L1-like esterase